MKTTEEFFNFEKKNQNKFDELYKSRGWSCERIYGKDNRKYDCILTKNGKQIKIEEKYRSQDYKDFLVEIMQDTETNSPGWLYYTEADYIIYGVSLKFYLIKVSKLKEFMQMAGSAFKKVISEKGWGRTENIAIPWEYVEMNNLGKLL